MLFRVLLDLPCVYSIPDWRWKTLASPSWLTQPSLTLKQESHDQLHSGAKELLEAYTGFWISCHKNQTRDFGARHTVEYDSVLSQQSISGKIISLYCVCGSQVFFQIYQFVLPFSFTVRNWAIQYLSFHIDFHIFSNFYSWCFIWSFST